MFNKVHVLISVMKRKLSEIINNLKTSFLSCKNNPIFALGMPINLALQATELHVSNSLIKQHHYHFLVLEYVFFLLKKITHKLTNTKMYKHTGE